VNKKHLLVPSCKFSQSAYLQELALYVGQELVFSDGEVCLEKIGNISITGKQIERLCHHYGQKLEEDLVYAEPTKSQKETTHYVMMDGSMVLCRADGWSEMKVARVFPANAVLESSPKRHWIHQSQYVAHLGNCQDFTQKLDTLIEHYAHKVFVADGAKWIWGYVDAFYPDSTQILDFYHAKEYLHTFGKENFVEKADYEAFINEYTTLLLDDKVALVIDKIQQIVPPPKAIESHKSIIEYYSNNSKRMLYKTFQEQGYAIGSGAMEAAHRVVIQERVKRSGQRWTKEGVQQVVNLRVAHQSNNWSKVVDFITNAA